MKDRHVVVVAAVIFTVIAVLHVLRLILGWQAVIGSFTVPVWASAVSFVVAAYLAYQFWTMK